MTDYSTAIPADVERSLRALQYREPLVFRSSMTREQFHEFVLKNSELKIERDRYGTITIHPPMTFDSGYYEGLAFTLLGNWALSDKTGRAFSPSTAFDMPDGAEYKADGAWISMEKINRLSTDERRRIARIVPDFIIEMRSETDRLAKLKKKITDGWIANGVRLAWLIDPIKERAWVYRADGSVVEYSGFEHVLSGEGVLPGFELDLRALKG